MLKLFSASDTSFLSNGDKILKATKAKIHKEDNGDYYLDIECSLDYIDYIIHGNIIVAPTPTGEQAFRIRNPEYNRKKITAKAYHLYYDAENYIVKEDVSITDKNCNDALQLLNDSTDIHSPFTVYSNITESKGIELTKSSLIDAFSKIIENWGGHMVRNNFYVYIMSEIGNDNGVTIRYGKNLKSIDCEENWDDVVTKVLPTGKDGIMLNALDKNADIFMYSDIQYDVPYSKIVSFKQDITEDEFKDEEGNVDEVAYKQTLIDDLRKHASDYLEENKYPKVNYRLEAHTDNIVDIGDKIEVIDERLGINLITSVISYDYDCVLKRYTEVEFGNFSKKLANLISSIDNTVDKTVNEKTSAIQISIRNDLQNTNDAIQKSLEQTQQSVNESLAEIAEVELYNSEGSFEEIELSQSVTPFSYIEIYYTDGTVVNSVKVYNPNNKNILLSISYETAAVQMLYLISDNKITPNAINEGIEIVRVVGLN